MREILVDYARYNGWANSRLLEQAEGLTEEQQSREITSSFPGIYKTFLHLWNAERAWLRRMEGQEQMSISEDPFGGSFLELSRGLKQADQSWIQWAEAQEGDAYFLTTITYRNSKGLESTQQRRVVMMQVFNHSSYHRGQVTTMLRQLGLEKIPATDFLVWSFQQATAGAAPKPKAG
jgi:uncharacterized damage-inducible protein DinB